MVADGRHSTWNGNLKEYILDYKNRDLRKGNSKPTPLDDVPPPTIPHLLDSPKQGHHLETSV